MADFAGFIELPDRQIDEEGDRFSAIEGALAHHHRVICDAVQRCVEKRHGRLMILAPPGAAKSTYTSVVAPPWIMGRWPKKRIILASYASEIAEKQSKKGRAICKSQRYNTLFDTAVPSDSRAADEWALTNGSQFMCGGILSGLTGNRGDVIIGDDLIKGRNEAESETIRTRTWEAYRDDFRTRIVSGGSIILMNTRWHQQDVSGMILPEGWDGQSGQFEGSDGFMWEVVSLPAKIETELQEQTDPLGRKMGEYLWPEYWDRQHWKQSDPALGSRDANTPTGRRAWYSMYQQNPHPDDGILFQREDFRWYEPDELPARLRMYVAGDWALTDELLKPDPDWTEVGVGGWDDGNNEQGAPRLYFTEWYSARKDVDVTVPHVAQMFKRLRNRLRAYFGEQGNIETLMWPLMVREARDRKIVLPHRVLLPTAGQGNKVMKAAGFKKLVEENRVWLPVGAKWAEDLVEQCCGFPGLAHDDKVDVGTIFGRAVDQMLNAPMPAVGQVREKVLTPLTYEWHERMMRQEAADKARLREEFE